MAKEPETKEVTPEVTSHPSAAHEGGTTRPGFRTDVSDAPDHNPNQNPNAVTPSQRVQEEQSAGRAAIRDSGRVPGFGVGIVNPADGDPARAADLAQKMNAAHEEADRYPVGKGPEGVRSPGDVPSRGMPADGLMEGDELLQGTPDHRTQDPRLLDRDSELARAGEARKEAQEAEAEREKDRLDQWEQRVQREHAERVERDERGERERGERERAEHKDKQAQHDRAANKTKK